MIMIDLLCNDGTGLSRLEDFPMNLEEEKGN